MFETSAENRLIGDLNAAVANGTVESYRRAANQFNLALGFATPQTEAVSRQSAQKLEVANDDAASKTDSDLCRGNRPVISAVLLHGIFQHS